MRSRVPILLAEIGSGMCSRGVDGHPAQRRHTHRPRGEKTRGRRKRSRARDRCKAMSTSSVRWRSSASGSMGSKARDILGDLRAVTSASLSRDKLTYRVGEPSWIDSREEDTGGSLAEAIETE